MTKEFDPTSEHHFPLLIIKAVEPGCTTEIQIEDVATGVVMRFTTTDEPQRDDEVLNSVVERAWEIAWNRYQERRKV